MRERTRAADNAAIGRPTARRYARFKWTPGQFDRLAGNSELRQELAGGAAPDSAMAGWPAELQAFALRSQAALLYPRTARLPASPLPRP